MSNTNRKLIWSLFIIFVVAMVITISWLVVASKKQFEEDRESEMRYATQIVDNVINKAFLRPITVAKVMSEDANLKEYLREASTNPTEIEGQVKDYLQSIRDGLGYKMMFAVCDSSGAYYTCDGITSYIDKDYQGNSKWYGDLMKSGKKYNLNVDIEESTDWELSVFVNQLVYDNKTLLGVCGTGVEVSQLKNLFELYERIYDVKINLTDNTGLIQIDTIVEKIQKDYISLPELNKISDGEYYYEKHSAGDRVITYMEDMDMYLVITNQKSNVTSILSDVFVPMIIALVSIGIAFFLILINSKLKKRSQVPSDL